MAARGVGVMWEKYWPYGAGAAFLGALYWLFKPGTASASGAAPGKGPCGAFSGDKKAIQVAINNALLPASTTDIAPANWMWPAKTNWKPAPITVDGKPGAMSCRAAEWLVANKLATPEIAAFAASSNCGCGKKRAPCGVGGPAAPQAVREKIISAGVAKGYPAADVAKAISRESGWKAQALNCQGADKHPVAAGLNGMLTSVLNANGFVGAADQFAALSAEEQLPYVLSFIKKMPASCLHLPGDFGLALFTPAYVCKPNDFVIYAPGTEGWKQNPGLRVSPDGPITAGKVRSTGH